MKFLKNALTYEVLADLVTYNTVDPQLSDPCLSKIFNDCPIRVFLE